MYSEDNLCVALGSEIQHDLNDTKTKVLTLDVAKDEGIHEEVVDIIDDSKILAVYHKLPTVKKSYS